MSRGRVPCRVAGGAGHPSQDRILRAVSYSSVLCVQRASTMLSGWRGWTSFSGQITKCCFLLFCTVCPEGEYHAEWLEGLAIHLRTEYYVLFHTLLYCVSRGRVPRRVAGGAGHPSQDRILHVVSYSPVLCVQRASTMLSGWRVWPSFSGQSTTCCFLFFCTVCPEGEYHAEWLEGLAIIIRTEYNVLFLTLLYYVSRGRVPC